jgi:fructoselysine 6-kinase
VGDNVIDRYLHCDLMFAGGNALNFAVFGRQAGAQAAYLGITGNDIPAGVIHALCAEGVDISRVRINQSFNALSQIDIDADGNRFFVGSVPPPYQLRLSEADLAWLADFDLLHTSDYSGLEAQLPQLAACAPLSFDFGSRDDAWAEPLLRWVQVATFSRSGSAPQAIETLIANAHAAGSPPCWSRRARTARLSATGANATASPRCRRRLSIASARGCIYRHAAGEAWSGSTLADAANDAALASARVCERLGAFGSGVPLTPLPQEAKQQP